MRSKFKIGLAGIGPHMLEHLLPALRLIPGVEISSAVSSSVAKRVSLAQKLWIPNWYDSIEALLQANNCDGVVASGSVDYHERVLEVCIENGVPVFVEKPPAGNPSSLSRLAKAAQEKGVVIGVGLNLPHTEIVFQVERFAYENKATIRKVKVDYHTNKPRQPLWNIGTLEESFLLAIFIHPLSLVQHFLGEELILSSAIVDTKTDAVHFLVELERNGATAVIESSNEAKRHICNIEFEFDHGEMLFAKGLTSLVSTHNHEARQLWSHGPLSLSLNSNGYLHEINEFIEHAQSCRFRNVLSETLNLYKIIFNILSRSEAANRSINNAYERY